MPIPIELQVAAITIVFSTIVGFFVLLFFFFNYLITSIKTDVDIKKSASILTLFYFLGIYIFNALTEKPSLFSQYGGLTQYGRLIGMILLVVNLSAVNYFFYYFLYGIKNNITVKRYAAILSVFFFLSLVTSHIFLNYLKAYTLPMLKELKAKREN